MRVALKAHGIANLCYRQIGVQQQELGFLQFLLPYPFRWRHIIDGKKIPSEAGETAASQAGQLRNGYVIHQLFLDHRRYIPNIAFTAIHDQGADDRAFAGQLKHQFQSPDAEQGLRYGSLRIELFPDALAKGRQGLIHVAPGERTCRCVGFGGFVGHRGKLQSQFMLQHKQQHFGLRHRRSAFQQGSFFKEDKVVDIQLAVMVAVAGIDLSVEHEQDRVFFEKK